MTSAATTHLELQAVRLFLRELKELEPLHEQIACLLPSNTEDTWWSTGRPSRACPCHPTRHPTASTPPPGVASSVSRPGTGGPIGACGMCSAN
jgi:hypothetical protein